ncbi:MAG TPA: 3-keto-5-aminohexanoate cleavage protein [Bacillota bacterium]|jgi:3-keto-5-aminohexanoate cleavage enzyme|nr:3-keto-5-aminohexanoate cleavage protein [Bacillota bacterium]HOP68514.1 3-keto-5-aminohexanoate cleavage protein [Bacillota bacterium]HPT33257.1 3-keto-5-aminohexanoate cleavage protein [Bacillota bacterium]HPZ65200.1 3-keto-5-aminohexanoate cleavage protein [Bacillota bacterium]HQD05650.1 3-keto-5-aminohexanoate cleavage protein [Bacillota bacterium]
MREQYVNELLRKKVVITAALSGAATFKHQNEAVPYTPEEFAEESYKCWKAGASIVHIHVRDPETGMPTEDLNLIRPTINAIRERCPELIINMSSAIRQMLTPEQRITPIKEMKPEMASLNTNSMNFALADYQTGEIGMEILFENTFQMLNDFALIMRENKVKPELEIYDLGGLYNVLLINKRKIIDEPMHFQFVFGVAGGVPFSPANLARMYELLPEGSTWSVCGVGPNQISAALSALAYGGHIRVGLEDNIRMPDRRLAKGSYEQVEWAVKLCEMCGREVATPAEARELLNLYPR